MRRLLCIVGWIALAGACSGDATKATPTGDSGDIAALIPDGAAVDQDSRPSPADTGERDLGPDSTPTPADGGGTDSDPIGDASELRSEVDGGVDTGPPAARSGLRQVAHAEVPLVAGSAPHLTEIVLAGRRAYVANIRLGVATFTTAEDGGLELQAGWPNAVSPTLLSCSTLAHHAPSDTLYCSAAFGASPIAGSIVTRLDLAADPDWPEVVEIEALQLPDISAVDLSVRTDTLWIASLNAGIWRAPIAGDGALGAPNQTVTLGTSLYRIQLIGADRVAVLDRDRGLRVGVEQAGELVEVATVPLDGPLLDLAHDGEILAVALGSEGAAVLRWDGTSPPELIARLQPKTAVAGVAVRSVDRSALVAAVGTSGVSLYDLDRGTTAIGYQRSKMVMLDAEFDSDGRLLVADWYDVRRYDVDRAGEALTLEAPRGRWIAPGAAASFPVRNPGGRTLHATAVHQLLGTAYGEPFAVPPGETREVEISPAALAEAAATGAPIRLALRTSELTAAGESLDEDDVVIVAQRPAEPDSQAPPALGQQLPGLRLEDLANGGIVELPESGATFRLTTFSTGCSAMWPQLVDLAWLATSGRDPEEIEYIVLDDSGGFLEQHVQFIQTWGLGSLRLYASGGLHGHIQRDGEWVYLGASLYTLGLLVDAIPGGASHPTDFIVVDGTVRGIERVYRGRWGLRDLVD